MPVFASCVCIEHRHTVLTCQSKPSAAFLLFTNKNYDKKKEQNICLQYGFHIFIGWFSHPTFGYSRIQLNGMTPTIYVTNVSPTEAQKYCRECALSRKIALYTFSRKKTDTHTLRVFILAEFYVRS